MQMYKAVPNDVLLKVFFVGVEPERDITERKPKAIELENLS
jgi:hypothetical protein